VIDVVLNVLRFVEEIHQDVVDQMHGLLRSVLDLPLAEAAEGAVRGVVLQQGSDRINVAGMFHVARDSLKAVPYINTSCTLSTLCTRELVRVRGDP
jgi:hypothetical protein